MAIQSSFSKIGEHMLTRQQMREAVKQLPDNLLDQETVPRVPNMFKKILDSYSNGHPADKIPDVAHFIWFSGKASLGGTPFKTIPPEALSALQKFKTLNPHFQVKLWTDAPHLMERAIRSSTHESGFPPVQVESFFKLFSDATPWPKYSQTEKATLHAAVLRELHRTNRNPQAAKDLAQFVVLRHEPGWFFDLDAEFYKPLPKTYAEFGSLCGGENNLMAFTEQGRAELDRILLNFINTYDPKHDISFTKKDFQAMKTALDAKPDLALRELELYKKKLARKRIPEPSVLKGLGYSIANAHAFFQPEAHLKGWLDKIYVMFDLKGASGRRLLTDELCLEYQRGGVCDKWFWGALRQCGIAKVPESSVFSEDPKVECWQDLPALRRRASSPELPTWVSNPL